MKIKIVGPADAYAQMGSPEDHAGGNVEIGGAKSLVVDIANHAAEPVLIPNFAYVEARGGTTTTVAKIEIENDEGLTARFWISIHLNKQGRPVLEVLTKGHDRDDAGPKEVAKDVTGTWKL